MLGPIILENDPPFLLHGSLWPTNLEKNLKPWIKLKIKNNGVIQLYNTDVIRQSIVATI